jgi:hypothetical protein
MRAQIEHAVDNDLGPGHGKEIRQAGRIGKHIAERSVIPARILEPGNRAFPGERRNRRAFELDVNADRDVIGNDGYLERFAQIAEMIDDLGLAGARIKGRRGHHGIDPCRLRRAGQRDNAIGRRIDHAGKNRNPPTGALERPLDDL